MKRRLMLWIGMLVLVASALFTVAYLLIIDSINEEACASIQNGITQAEVAGMLGRPFDRADCHLDWGKSQNPDGTWSEVRRFLPIRIWHGRSGDITVMFNETGTVEDVWFRKTERDVSVIQRFRGWLGFDPPTPPPPSESVP